MNFMPRRIVRGQKRATARGADGGGHIKLPEPGGLTGEPVKIRGFYIGMPGKMRIGPTLIIRKYKNDVRSFSLGRVVEKRGGHQSGSAEAPKKGFCIHSVLLYRTLGNIGYSRKEKTVADRLRMAGRRLRVLPSFV